MASPAAAAGPQAHAATTCPTRGDSGICWWKVRKVHDAKGTDRHAWIDCVRFKKSRLPQHVTCSIAKSKSDTVTAQVGGNVTVKIAELSASVGYSVTQTTTVTTSDTVDVPAHTAGKVQWAGVYADRKRVVQEYTPCYQTAPGTYDYCIHRKHPKPENLATAFTEKYDSPTFRVVSHKKS